MPDITHPFSDGIVSLFPNYRPFESDVRILIVVDGGIGTKAGNEFGLSRVIDLIDGYQRGCTRFTVDTARRRPASTPFEATAEDEGHLSIRLRFDDRVDERYLIDDYDQIWMFGFESQGSPTTLDDDELGVLTAWMNRGGAIFATGDHDTLGAALCARVPRVGQMRRWTRADEVPPSGSPFDRDPHKRIDTTQPVGSLERRGLAEIANDNERDLTPQPIEWVPTEIIRTGRLETRTPHEILCHPRLGVIDVMPDHPHEGRTRTASEIDLTAQYDFGTIAGDEFPRVGDMRPSPSVIAFGNTTSTSLENGAPLDHEKGRVDPARFPMITVYDGAEVGVGRVVVDSTWHHWFDMNLVELEAHDTEDWKKIRRYFENVAAWLVAPPRIVGLCYFLELWGRYPLLEEVALTPVESIDIDLPFGASVRRVAEAELGRCAVARIVLDDICDRHPGLCEALGERQFDPRDPRCLSCPPMPLLEDVAVSGIMRGSLAILRDVVGQPDVVESEEYEQFLLERFNAGIDTSLQEFAREYSAGLRENLDVWSSLLGSTAD